MKSLYGKIAHANLNVSSLIEPFIAILRLEAIKCHLLTLHDLLVVVNINEQGEYTNTIVFVNSPSESFSQLETHSNYQDALEAGISTALDFII